MMKILAIVLLLGQTSYLWKPIQDAPKEIALWKDGKQIGALDTETLEFFKLEAGKFTKAQDVPHQIPDKVIDEAFEKRCKKTGDYGVAWDKISPDKEVFTFNGEDIDKEEFQQLVGDVNPLVDDSGKLHLTIIADKAQKEPARQKLTTSEVYQEFEKDIHLQVFSSNSWILKEHGFKSVGPVTYYLQESNGKVIYSGDSQEALLDKLRIFKKPPPAPWSLDWTSWTVGFNPFTWMAGLSWSKLHIPFEPIILIVILVLGFFLIRNRKGK